MVKRKNWKAPRYLKPEAQPGLTGAALEAEVDRFIGRVGSKDFRRGG